MIGGHTQALRDYWSNTASHMGSDPLTRQHIVDYRAAGIRTRFRHSDTILKRNMVLLFHFLSWNVVLTAKCLSSAGGDLSEDLAGRIDDLRVEGIGLFPTGSTSLDQPLTTEASLRD